MDLFCEQSQPDYVQLECGSELGGIIALGLIVPTLSLDLSTAGDIAATLENAAWWNSRIADSPQTAWKILDTRGEVTPGTPTEEEGFGLIPTERTGDDRELTFEALGVFANRNFWASVNKKRNWRLVYITAGTNDDGNYEAFYVENVSVYASDVVPRSIKSRKMYNGSAKWSTNMTPALPFYAPQSVFTVTT